MMLRDLLLANRSCRRFKEAPVPRALLCELVELARLAPSAGNVQPLRFRLVDSAEECARVFPTLAWAAYFKDWPGPAEGERPSAYIVVVSDSALGQNKQCDAGIAALALSLGAQEKGLASCMLGSIKRPQLAAALGIDPARYTIELVLALGVRGEEACTEDAVDGAIRYYRDARGVHHVPKRPLSELLLS